MSGIAALTMAAALAAAGAPPERLRALASGYYEWLTEEYPVRASDQGLHTRDDRLTDWSEAARAARTAHMKELLAEVSGMKTADWPKDDRVDWLLFQSQLEREEMEDRVWRFAETNPQLYVDECANAVFSLLKKDYAPRRTRALAAAARLAKMPALLSQAKKNLARPQRLYAKWAIQAARSMDGLFGEPLGALAGDLSAKERTGLEAAKGEALAALRDFASWLEERLPAMPEFVPMGEQAYDAYLKRAYLLPLDARRLAMLGEAELARYRGLEALLPNPAMADPDPSRAAVVPKDQASFLAAYESRQAEMIRFLKEKRLVTFPAGLGPFLIRRLPDAFRATSPGGFMNPPGLYDKDPSGFYFIPTYDPKSRNFYLRAAVEDPRPILGHEGIPGHFLQISIANGLKDQIRRQQNDGIFIEGWALYTEEMLTRTGLYPEGSAAQGQVLRLSRYRAARIGVDVNLHCGKWTFEQAVKYFMEAGGLDREAAEGEAAGAASNPTQKITYITGKWQILGLLGKYRDRKGAAFRLGEFHDDLLKNGSLPVSVVEWLLLDDRSDLDEALR